MAQMSRSQAEDFLYHEARLLDEGRLEDWLSLFTHDAYYWIPSNKGADPRVETPIVYDSREGLEDRISRLRSPAAHSQSPPSRTTHLISNVEVKGGENGISVVYSGFVVYEVRLGLERSMAGRCEHHVREEEGEWRIALKKVWLINRDAAIYNLTFLL